MYSSFLHFVSKFKRFQIFFTNARLFRATLCLSCCNITFGVALAERKNSLDSLSQFDDLEDEDFINIRTDGGNLDFIKTNQA